MSYVMLCYVDKDFWLKGLYIVCILKFIMFAPHVIKDRITWHLYCINTLCIVH